MNKIKYLLAKGSRATQMSALAIAVLVAGVSLTVVAWQNSIKVVAAEDQERFQHETSNSLELIEERMETYGQVLRGVKGLFVASRSVDRDEFKAYTEELKLEKNYPGILGVAFSLYIAADELERHIAAVRAEGFPQYTLVPEGDRQSYTAIIFIEPFSGNNLKAFGFDMYSEPVRRAAMDKARLRDDLALSGKVSLVQDASRGSVNGVLLYLPVFQEGNKEDLLGWVYAPFSMDILMQGIQLDKSQIDLAIYDGAAISAATQLYSSKVQFQNTDALPFRRVEQIEIAHQIWTVVLSADDDFVQSHDSSEPIAVLFVGGLFTLLMTLLVWSLSSRKERAEAKAAAMNRELSETEFRFKSALAGAEHGVWDWNNLTNEVTFDTKWKSMLGYADDEISNDISQWRRLIHPLDKDRAEAAVSDFFSGKTENYSLEHRLKTRDGHWRWVVTRGDIVSWTETGEPARIIGTHTDITEQKNLELALIESDQRFRGAFETAAVGMALVGLAGEWMEVNQSLLEMLQYQEAELLKLTFQDITHPDDLSLDLEQLTALTAGEIKSYQMEKRYFRKDGAIIWVYLSVSMVTDGNGKPAHYVAQVEDVTARKELEREILHQSTHDALTGLPNRRLLYDRLSRTFALSRRYQRPFALMYIDVDHFKEVNDQYGHEVGDQFLKWLADKISACVRTSDTLARQGGDEFVLMLAEISEAEDAALVAGKILHAIKDEFVSGGVALQASLSVGIAIYHPESLDSVEDLLKHADLALYQVKRAGRNGFKLYQAEDE